MTSGSVAPGPRSDHVVDLDVVYRDARPRLIRLAVLLVDDLPTAEDVVQDVFARLQRGTNARVESIDGYLTTAVLNTARSLLRRRSVAGRGLMRLGTRPSADRDDDIADLSAEQSRVWQAITRLPTRQRQVVVCRYYLDLARKRAGTRSAQGGLMVQFEWFNGDPNQGTPGTGLATDGLPENPGRVPAHGRPWRVRIRLDPSQRDQDRLPRRDGYRNAEAVSDTERRTGTRVRWLRRAHIRQRHGDCVRARRKRAGPWIGHQLQLAGERGAQAGFLDAPVAVLLAVDEDDRHAIGVLVTPVAVGVDVELVVAEAELGRRSCSSVLASSQR